MGCGYDADVGHTIYTIGHGSRSLQELREHLERWQIDLLIDVRSQPYSRHRPHFSRAPLEVAIVDAGIEYRYMGSELGGKPDDPALSKDGEVDYEKIRALSRYRAAIAQVAKLVRDGRRPALLCAEGSPSECHRARLLAPDLGHAGLSVLHVLRSGDIEPHELLARRQLASQAELFPNLTADGHFGARRQRDS